MPIVTFRFKWPRGIGPSIYSWATLPGGNAGKWPSTGVIRSWFSSRRRHPTLQGGWSSDVCSSDLNPNVPTSETGTRHRTAERVARSIEVPVVSVSEDQQVIAVYVGAQKPPLETIPRLLNRAKDRKSVV